MPARVDGRGRVRYKGIAGHDNLRSNVDIRESDRVRTPRRASARIGLASNYAGEQTELTRATMVISYVD